MRQPVLLTDSVADRCVNNDDINDKYSNIRLFILSKVCNTLKHN